MGKVQQVVGGITAVAFGALAIWEAWHGPTENPRIFYVGPQHSGQHDDIPHRHHQGPPVMRRAIAVTTSGSPEAIFLRPI